MTSEDAVCELIGEKIRHLFKDAEGLAKLHACLTSPRGDNFRLHLPQAMEAPLDSEAVERLRAEAQVNEYHRHMHMLLGFGLAEAQGTNGDTLYVRTSLGEQAINALHEAGTADGQGGGHGLLRRGARHQLDPPVPPALWRPAGGELGAPSDHVHPPSRSASSASSCPASSKGYPPSIT